MNYREVVAVLLRNGFTVRQSSSHHIFRGTRGGATKIVVIAYHRESAQVPKNVMASIIRTSGLPKKLFE